MSVCVCERERKREEACQVGRWPDEVGGTVAELVGRVG